ncbi:MAG: superoxide reductase [Methanobacteriota archaeon]|nr:MAG: superoxide reductase [Euryarchaeota archaeon]
MTEDLFSDINRAGDPSSLSDLEKKHLPLIDAPDSVKAGEPFEVTVEVGRLLAHPNEPGHHIQWIVLLGGSVTLAMVELTPVSTSPKVTVTITLDKTTRLRALERCNLHGEWEHSKEIKVL